MGHTVSHPEWVEHAADESRTVTTYDNQGNIIATRPYTPDENATADQQISDAARLDDLAEKVAILWAAVFPPDPEPEPGEPIVAPEFFGIWHPGTLISDTDGRVYRNISGQPLVHPPSAMTPDGGDAWIGSLYVLVTGDPDPEPEPGDRPAGYVGPWDPDATYAIGNVVDRAGRYYRAKVAHGPEYQGTWGPPQASVWDDIGPVA